MSQKEKMIENLKREIDGYYIQLVYLSDLISVQLDIRSIPELCTIAPNFKRINEIALCDAYMMVLMRLFDKTESSDTKSIPSLLAKCIKTSDLFSNKEEVKIRLNEFKTEMSENDDLSSLIESIRIRRDKIYAHNDKKYFGEKIANIRVDYNLKMSQVILLRDYAEKVLSYICSQLAFEPTRKSIYNNDLSSLFSKMRCVRD